ncbi:hypothetical protein CEXT_325861 [Caerostris extrusa]|uniref:Uncharacterized protein n=1 Tax=Caerostris extrusa TaxID=172846 RepID=A0AAV4SAX4_CAEEX|nr:hypothetical protein CEXT_325861 [Caerostris extrusa]
MTRESDGSFAGSHLDSRHPGDEGNVQQEWQQLVSRGMRTRKQIGKYEAEKDRKTNGASVAVGIKKEGPGQRMHSPTACQMGRMPTAPPLAHQNRLPIPLRPA